jgi:hypothetical protein
MPAWAMHMTVPDLFCTRIANCHHLYLVIKRPPRERMVEIYVGIKLTYFLHYHTADSTLGLY